MTAYSDKKYHLVLMCHRFIVGNLVKRSRIVSLFKYVLKKVRFRILNFFFCISFKGYFENNSVQNVAFIIYATVT